MPIINGAPLPQIEVFYHGTQIPPKPAVLPILPEKTTIVYDGQTLSQIPARAIPIVQNPANDPSYCVIGNVVLSANILLPIKNKKLIAKSQIVDGVTVFEHVSREAAEIDFDFTIFPAGVIQGTASNTNAFNNVTTFNQTSLNTFWSTIWSANTIQAVQNTYLNGLGISQIIIESITVIPMHGKPNVGVKMRALENQVAYGNAFNISTLISTSGGGGF